MMTQTLAIFLDAYREVASKKLFWITLVLSGLIVGVFGGVGIHEDGFSLFVWEFKDDSANLVYQSRETFYTQLFIDYGIGVWLTWIAAILAIVSTGGIIPDLIGSGSIELSLSKPIGRWRLFLTKYAAGLTFAALQVGVFTLASFLVLGLRGGAWLPGLFLAIPVVVVFFSYLFCVCAFLGLLTRSTVASILLTLLFWFVIFIFNFTDGMMLGLRHTSEINEERVAAQLDREEQRVARIFRQQNGGAEAPEPSEAQLDALSPRLVDLREDLPKRQQSAETWRTWSRLVVGVKTVLPKTGETVAVLPRWLMPSQTDEERVAEMERRGYRPASEDPINFFSDGANDAELIARLEKAAEGRSLAWVILTSIAFEVVVLLLCCWIFTRRDF